MQKFTGVYFHPQPQTPHIKCFAYENGTYVLMTPPPVDDLVLSVPPWLTTSLYMPNRVEHATAEINYDLWTHLVRGGMGPANLSALSDELERIFGVELRFYDRMIDSALILQEAMTNVTFETPVTFPVARGLNLDFVDLNADFIYILPDAEFGLAHEVISNDDVSDEAIDLAIRLLDAQIDGNYNGLTAENVAAVIDAQNDEVDRWPRVVRKFLEFLREIPEEIRLADNS
jgi:hypothetical protein